MWPDPQETADLVTFTEEILNGKLHFLCSGLMSSKFEKGVPIHRRRHRRCSMKKGILKISQNSQENNCVGISFFVKLKALIQTFFPWILRNFDEHLLTEHLRKTASDFRFVNFYKIQSKSTILIVSKIIDTITNVIKNKFCQLHCLLL